MRVKLLSSLRKFGEEWELEVSSPAEALRAIAVQRPDFIDHLISKDEAGIRYQVLTGEMHPLPESELQLPITSNVLIISPVISGSSGNPIVNGILGAGLIATAFLVPGGVSLFGLNISSSMFGLAGVALVRSGVSQLLSPSPKIEKLETQSQIIDNNLAVSRQGSRVPVPYGDLLLKDLIPISSGVVEETRVDTIDTSAQYKRATMLPLAYIATALENYSYHLSNRTFRSLNTDFLTNRDPYTGTVIDKNPFNSLKIRVTFSTAPTGLNIQSAYALQRLRIFSTVDGYEGTNFLEVFREDGIGLMAFGLNPGWNDINLDPYGQFNSPQFGYTFVFHHTNTAIPHIAVGELELYGCADENLANIKA